MSNNLATDTDKRYALHYRKMPYSTKNVWRKEFATLSEAYTELLELEEIGYFPEKITETTGDLMRVCWDANSKDKPMRFDV